MTGDTLFIEKPHQIGVIPVVIDDKAGINCETTRAQMHVVGSRMTPYSISGFKNVDAMARFGQLIRASQPGDARSNDCNIHC
jgi:hypothetical protein